MAPDSDALHCVLVWTAFVEPSFVFIDRPSSIPRSAAPVTSKAKRLSVALAYVYIGLGDKDRAFAWLEKATPFNGWDPSVRAGRSVIKNGSERRNARESEAIQYRTLDRNFWGFPLGLDASAPLEVRGVSAGTVPVLTLFF